jgi:hypothetical protein
MIKMSQKENEIKTLEIAVEETAPIVAPVIETAPRATKLREAKEKKAKEPKDPKAPKTEVTRPKREVMAVEIKPVDQQKKWEKRGYMREEGESAETVRHKSKFGIKEAFEAGMAFMKGEFLKTGQTKFDVPVVIHACHSTGPAYGDCFRNAFKKEANSKHPLVHYHLKKASAKSRASYEVVLAKCVIEMLKIPVETPVAVSPAEIQVAPVQ